MFWENISNDLDTKPFIIDGNNQYTFNEIFSIADSLYEDIPSRSVILIESERDIGTVISYIGALRNRTVPLLIDSKSATTYINKLVADYKIDFIVSVNDCPKENYKLFANFYNRFIFQRLGDLGETPFEQLALLMPTSGSTGEAKCVKTSYTNLNEVTFSIMRYMNMDQSRVSISSLQLHYTYGLSVLNLAIASRSKFVLTSHSWIDREFWSLVDRYKISDLSGVPFMFQTLRRIKLSEHILKNLKCINQAGGRLEPKITEYFIKYFSSYNIPYLTMYGATEASPRISYVPAERAIEKLGTVGISIDIGQLFTDHEDCKSEGELIYEGPNVFLGYARSRDDLANGDENNNILRTGDIGFIDDDGYATIVGRKKRFVKVFGISVNLDALESIVKNIVPESVVLGKDDNIKVLFASDFSANELKQEIMCQVTFSNKGLKVISVPEIYLNSSGKPDYPKLSREFL